MQKVRGSSPLSSTFRDKKPFDDNVEGLSYLWAETSVDESAVQPDDFEDLTFFGVVCDKPSLAKGLRKFKHLGRYLGVFVAGTIQNLQLEHDRGKTVTHFCLFAVERRFVDLVVDSQVQQPVLLSGNHRFLTLEFGSLGTSIGLSACGQNTWPCLKRQPRFTLATLSG